MLNKILVKVMRLVNDVNQRKTIGFIAMRGLAQKLVWFFKARLTL